jgi:hypothetical protein
MQFVIMSSRLGRTGGMGPAHPAPLSALHVREVDTLISRLLGEIRLPLPAAGGAFLLHLGDLRKVLARDYRQAPGLPSREMLRELAATLERDLKPLIRRATDVESTPAMLDSMTRAFGPRSIEVCAQPYRRGAGMQLRGFYCRAEIARHRKFVIFLNTAHLPAAVAATFGHELGHYIYDAVLGQERAFGTFVEGAFASHLDDPAETFADSLVALSAYEREMIDGMGRADRLDESRYPGFLSWIKRAHTVMAARFGVDLRSPKTTPVRRIRYLTSLIHFLKLRRALLEYADL